MAFHSIAYDPDQPCILTIDGCEVLAYDAATESPRFKLELPATLRSIAFAPSNPFAKVGGPSPFRNQATHIALLLDVEGRVSILDTTLGQLVGEIAPLGEPTALAVSSSTAAAAIATEEAIYVFRAGERTELTGVSARALGFSRDGATLVVGTERGAIRMYSVSPDAKAPLEETYKKKLDGAIFDVAQHPNGDWVIVGEDGATLVSGAGESRLHKVPPDILRAAFDANGQHLVVQRAERGLVTYAWPSLSVVMRAEYTDRPIRGLAFGPEKWLGVGLDHGDANKIDLGTSAVHRTDTHPGREHRSWTLLLEGKKELQAAREAEDLRRMRSSADTSKTSNVASRATIGAMISIALIAIRVCVRTSSTPSYHPVSIPPTFAKQCNRECVRDRLTALNHACARTTPSCVDDVKAAETAVSAGSCDEAKVALKRVRDADLADSKRDPLFTTTQLLAELGLSEACSAGNITPDPVANRRVEIVRFKPGSKGALPSALRETLRPRGETALGLWVASDDTAFLVTKTSSDRLHVRMKVFGSASPEWSTITERSTDSFEVRIFGRTSSDVWMTDGTSLLHYDGSTFAKVVDAPAVSVAVAGVGNDPVVLGEVGDTRALFQKRGSTWARDGATLPSSSSTERLTLVDLFSAPKAPNGLFAIAKTGSDDVLLQRVGARWTIRKPPTASDAEDVTPTLNPSVLWVSPTGEAFVGTGDESVLRISTKGVEALPSQGIVSHIWGRSSGDVYAASDGQLQRFDGKRWSTLDHDGTLNPRDLHPTLLSGTSTELVLVGQTDR